MDTPLLALAVGDDVIVHVYMSPEPNPLDALDNVEDARTVCGLEVEAVTHFDVEPVTCTGACKDVPCP